MLYCFDNFEVDLDTFELRRDGRVIPTRKTTFDVLRYLIAHRNRVVSKQELIDKLWTGTHVNEAVVPWYISNIRKLVGQQSTELSPVETVHGRGYQFKSEVKVVEKNARRPEPYSPRPTIESDGPFVGREAVMESLNIAVNNVLKGGGCVVLLRGEAGIGKTRCAAEFSSNEIARGRSVWMGRCPESASQPPFWPWIQILRNAASEQPDDPSIQVESSRLLSTLVPHYRDNAISQPADFTGKTTEKFWLYDRLIGFLGSSSRNVLRILIIDDLQWADEASLEFLSFIAPDIANLNILLLTTLRDYEELGNRSVHLYRLLRFTKQIPLTGFSQENVDQYVSRFGLFEPDEALNRALYQKTGGNPLFLYETFRLLERAHANSKRELTAADVRHLEVPDSVQKLIQYRLDTVDPKIRSVLDVASVLGPSFDLRLLAQTIREEVKALVEVLDQAIEVGLITKEALTLFRFTHDLICEVAYKRLSSTTRADYHDRAAKTLLDRLDSGTNIEKAAFHLHRALPLSDIEATIRTCRRAAELSAMVYAHGDAAVYYRWVLDAIESSNAIDLRVKTQILVSLGVQERLSGDVERSRRTVNEALQMARTHRFFDIVSDIPTIGRATFLSAHIPRPAVLKALEEALDHVPEVDKALRIQLLSQLALTPPYSTDMQLCKDTCQQAVRLADELDDKQSMHIALNAALCSYTGPDDIDALLTCAEKILRLQSEGEWTQAGIEALLARILAHIHRGDMPEAKKSVEVYGALMTQLHRVEGQWFYQRLFAQFVLDEGRFAEALRRFAELTRRAKRIGIYYFDIFHRLQTVYVSRTLGATVEQINELGTHTLERFRDVSTRAELIGLIVEMGCPEVVRDAYSSLIAQGVETIPRNAMWLNSLSNLALAAVAFDDRQRIKEFYELLSPYAGFNTPNSIFLYNGSVAHYLGILASKLDSDAKAIRYFEQAIEANQRMALRPQLLRTQVVFAEWLKHRGGGTNKRRLKAVLDEALSSAREMKIEPLLNRAKALCI